MDRAMDMDKDEIGIFFLQTVCRFGTPMRRSVINDPEHFSCLSVGGLCHYLIHKAIKCIYENTYLVAIGSARLIGIYFPDNFNWPYMATSPRDFWKRWHITLSSWVRDYLYLPLSRERFRDRSGKFLSYYLHNYCWHDYLKFSYKNRIVFTSETMVKANS